MSAISSTVYVRTPEQVVRVWTIASREATDAEKRAGKANYLGQVSVYKKADGDVVGCTHHDCRIGWRYSDKSRSPATTAWVTKPYAYSNDPDSLGVVFYCSRHTGNLRSVRARTTGYEDDRIMQVAGARGKNELVPEDAFDLVSVEAVAANPGAFIVLATEKLQARKRAADKARRDYIDEHRQEYLDAFHSEEDGQSYFGASASLEAPDEYGRRYIKVGGVRYDRRANPAAARAFAAELLKLADEAEKETPRS